MRPRDVHRARHIAAEHRRREPILVVVGAGHGLVVAVDSHDALHGTERFLAVRCACPASRGRAASQASACSSALPPHTSVAPLASASSISALQRSTVLMSTTEPEHHRALCAGRRAADSTRLRAAWQRTHRRSARIDDDPFRRHADLSRIGERAERGGVDGGIEIGVVEHDQRRLAAEFEHRRASDSCAQVAAMILPTWVEPVKLTRRTVGCAIMRLDDGALHRPVHW